MSRPGYIFLTCPDAELLHGRIAEILDSNNSSDFEKKVYWADDELPSTFWDDLTLQTLFGSSKAIILRRAHTLKVATWKMLDKALSALSSSSFLFLCLEGAWTKKSAPIPAVLKKQKCWQYAEKQNWVWQSAGLDEKSITGFINQWSARTSILMDNGVKQALTKALPKDARAAKLELDKLELAAGPEKKLLMDHLDMIAFSEDMNFFEFMNAMSQGGDTIEIWRRVLTNHMEKDSMIFMLTASLTREARNLWMMLHGEESSVGLPPFVKKQKKVLAQRLGPARIAKIFDIVLEAEIGIKTGSRRPEQALELLVAALTSLFAVPQSSRRR